MDYSFTSTTSLDNNKIEQKDTSKMTKTQLLDKCKELKIKNCNSKSKSELIEFINLKNKVHDFQPATTHISLLPSIIKHLCSFHNL